MNGYFTVTEAPPAGFGKRIHAILEAVIGNNVGVQLAREAEVAAV